MDGIEIVGLDAALRSLPELKARAVMAAGAAEYKAAWIGRFRELDAKGNARALPRSHFWAREGARKTEAFVLGASEARVTCASAAVAFQAYGGTVRPVSAKALAVPVSGRAKRAGWPSNSGLPLRFVPIRSRKNPHVVGKLVEAEATRISYTKEGRVKKGATNTRTAGTTHYLLMDEMTLEGIGEAALPERASAYARVAKKMGSALDRQLKPVAG
jgi:hypothetical protein